LQAITGLQPIGVGQKWKSGKESRSPFGTRRWAGDCGC